MRLPFNESVAVVAIVAGLTYLIRLLPFTIFRNAQQLPPAIVYLGKVLPFAVIAMLVVFCFKDITLNVREIGIHLAAALFVVVVHRRFHNMLLSIGGGTAVYMILLRIV
ncbi:MAG: AzlD domain-containing protein [Eubacteriales bacterium]|nr:AzlD domain-containing protein [Eubacteriales bacterium]